MAEYGMPLAMVAALMVGIFSGYPVAFVLGGIGVLFMFIADVPLLFLGTAPSRIFTGTLSNWLLLAVPLFVFMGLMLEKSDVARSLLSTLEDAFRDMRGGLAISVTVLGIIMAAATGIIGASVVMLGLMAMPMMMRRNYSKPLASGVICSAGTLGILIPPSIMLVLVGDILRIPVGKLFMGAIVPGLILGALYIGYIVLISHLKPDVAPVSDGNGGGQGNLALRLLKDLVAPSLLIIGVLGSIVAGVATPTEAAGIGAAGTLLLAIVNRTLTWKVLKEAVYGTAQTSAMILFVAIGATVFSVVFKRVGGDRMIEDAIAALAAGPYQTLLLIMLLIFLLGFFLEWIEISYVVLPLFAPIIAGLEFGLANPESVLVWFAILVAINLQTSFLTPPFGYALFYLRGIAPEGLEMSHIYRGIIPFVLLQLTGLALAIAFPSIVLWLPGD